MFLTVLYLIIPFAYILLISGTKRDKNSIVCFNLWGGFLILVFYMFTLIFVETGDKVLYLESYLDAENYYEIYNRELLWGKLQILLSYVLYKNEILYWLFYSIFYCVAYYTVAKKFFPYHYAGYFVLCVVSCMGFVSYGSNTIRAGFGIVLLLLAFCSKRKPVKIGLSIVSIGCHMSMLLPVVGYLTSEYIIKKERWSEVIWIICLIITSLTSVVSDIMVMFGGLDARTEGLTNFDGTSNVYNVGFRIDFLIYSIVPILFAKYNLKHVLADMPIYKNIYRTYLLVNALWLLLIRVPYTDRFAYLSWFMIPFLLLYPVLNNYIDIKKRQRYILISISIFLFVNIALALR